MTSRLSTLGSKRDHALIIPSAVSDVSMRLCIHYWQPRAHASASRLCALLIVQLQHLISLLRQHPASRQDTNNGGCLEHSRAGLAAGCAPYGPARTLPADSQRNSVYTFTFIAITVYAITHRKFTLQDNHRSPFTHNDNNNVTLLPLLQNSPFEPVTIQIQRRNRSAIQHCKLLVTTCTSYLH